MPDPKEAVLLLALVTVVVGFGLVAVSSAYEDAPTGVERVTNESLTQDVGNWTAVDAAGRDGVVRLYDNETVRNASGDPLEEGVDYEFAPNGSVRFLSSSSTWDGASAEIDYSIERRPAQATAMLAPIRSMFGIVGLLPRLLGAMLLLIGARQLYRVANQSPSRGGRR